MNYTKGCVEFFITLQYFCSLMYNVAVEINDLPILSLYLNSLKNILINRETEVFLTNVGFMT